MKVFSFILFFCLILKETQLKVIDNSEVICEVKYKFSKICHFYRLDNKCDHLEYKTCQVTKISRNEFKCPIYFCKKVIAISYIFYKMDGDKRNFFC